MRKSEIINAVMSEFPDVLNTTVVDADDNPRIEPGNVIILVTTDLVSADDQYNLRVSIGQMLEPNRPAGVSFEVMVQSRMGEARPVPGFAESFAPRSRFMAVVAEITEHIAPVKKPPPPVVEKLRAPQLFEQVIEVALGVPSPCPRCKCQAFTPDENKKQAACRGCQLPSPLFSIEYKDAIGLATSEYKCCSCGAKSAVSMTMSQINLYCWGCGKLALHDVKEIKLRAKPGEYINQVLGVPIPVRDPSRRADGGSRVLKGSKAIFTFNDVVVELGLDVLDVGDLADADMVNLYKDVPPGEGYSISMTLTAESSQNWVDTIEKLQQKVAGSYGISFEELTSSPAAQLAELFREKLGLLPFAMYEQQQRNENILREGRDLPSSGRDRDRRTGRTTRAMVRAIAKFMTSDLRFFCVVGHTQIYTKELLIKANQMYRQLNLARRMDIKPLFPDDYDPSSDYERGQRALVYVDHIWAERALQGRR